MKIQPGATVAVSANTDVWLSEIRAGRAFMAGDVQAAVAAQSSHIQLFNPLASGKQVIGRYLIASCSVAVALFVRRYDTALTTASGTEANLLIGGAAPVGQLRKQTSVAMLGTQILVFFIAANAPLPLAPDWIMELSPGQGVLVTTSTVNVDLEANWFWREA